MAAALGSEEGEGEIYADHEDGFVGRQLGGRGHYDSELDGEQRGRLEPGAWGGGAGAGGAGAGAGRGLHASWLDAAWVERLLGPTLEQHWEVRGLGEAPGRQEPGRGAVA